MNVQVFVLASITGLSLASCLAMPGDSVGGGSRPLPVPPPQAFDSGAETYSMLEDPEADYEETSEEIWATSQADADRKCEAIAQRRTAKGGTLVTVQGKAQQRTSNPSSTGAYRFVCRFRVEL